MTSPYEGPTEAQWLSHKTKIRNMVLVRTMKNAEIVKELELHVTEKQLINQLNKWGIRRKIPKGKSKSGWRYIGHRVAKRTKQGKVSVVILNGRVLDPKNINKNVSRNQPSTLERITQGINSPKTPEGLDITICSPIPLQHQSPPSQIEILWPQNLPWFIFQRSFTFSMPSSASYDGDTGTLLESLPGLLISRNGNNVSSSVEDPSSSYVSQMASKLRSIVPEAVEDENSSRARNLVKGSIKERCKEYTRILLFELSNNIYPDDITRVWPIVLSLLRSSGITKNRRNLRSTTNMTILALAEKLFQMAANSMGSDVLWRSHSMQTETMAIFEWLLSSGLDPNTAIYYQVYPSTVLQVAVDRRNLKVIWMLLDRGADPNKVFPITACLGIDLPLPPCLAGAISGENYPERIDLINKLLELGANPSQYHCDAELSPLIAAAKYRDFSTLELLIHHEAKITAHPIRHNGKFSNTPFNFESLIGTQSALGWAVSASPESLALEMAKYLLHHIQRQNPSDQLSSIIPVDGVLIGAAMGYNTVINLLLNEGVCINTIGSKGFSALHIAALWGHTETCELLLARGALADASSTTNCRRPSPLHLAAAGGHTNVVKLLCEWGADINGTRNVKADGKPIREIIDNENFLRSFCKPISQLYVGKDTILFCGTPIGVAIYRLEPAATYQYLLSNGATIPSWALYYGAGEIKDTELVSFLLQNGQDPNSKCPNGLTPLQAALIQRGLFEIERREPGAEEIDYKERRLCENSAMLLLKHGAVVVGGEAVQAARLGNWELVEEILSRDTNKVAQTHPDRTMLHAAILSRSSNTIEKVFAQYSTTYDSGALCAAAVLAGKNGGMNSISRLLKNRPTCEVSKDQEGREGLAVGVAALHKNIPLLKLLLETIPVSCTMIIPDRFWTKPKRHEWVSDLEAFQLGSANHGPLIQVSPLLFTVDSTEARELLLHHGCRPDRITLSYVVLINNLVMMKQLLKYYRRNDSFRLFSLGPLYQAIQQSNIEMTRILLAAGEDINETSYDSLGFRKYLIQSAAENGDIVIVELLINAGADINTPATDNCGATALQRACIKGYLGVAKMLMDHGANVNARRANIRGRTALEGAAEHGRIDMIQFLLTHGANTEGHGRLQYVRAIALATQGCHHTAVKILRAHRQWTESDEFLLQKIDLDDECSFGEDPGDAESELDWNALPRDVSESDSDEGGESDSSELDGVDFAETYEGSVEEIDEEVRNEGCPGNVERTACSGSDLAELERGTSSVDMVGYGPMDLDYLQEDYRYWDDNLPESPDPRIWEIELI